MKSVYQQRKAEGKCVRPGCERKPKLGKDGKPRSYCTHHNEMNKANTAACLARQAKGEKPTPRPKAAKVRKPKAEKVKPAPKAKVVDAVEVPGIGTVELVAAAPEAWGDRVTRIQEERSCTRKIAAQYLRRLDAKLAKEAAKSAA
jgi:hypothetical protein